MAGACGAPDSARDIASAESAIAGTLARGPIPSGLPAEVAIATPTTPGSSRAKIAGGTRAIRRRLATGGGGGGTTGTGDTSRYNFESAGGENRHVPRLVPERKPHLGHPALRASGRGRRLGLDRKLALGEPAHSWNTITVTVPSNAAALHELGVNFVTNATWAGTAYVDAVTW